MKNIVFAWLSSTSSDAYNKWKEIYLLLQNVAEWGLMITEAEMEITRQLPWCKTLCAIDTQTGQVVGVTQLFELPHMTYTGNLVVSKQYQCHGIATELMQQGAEDQKDNTWCYDSADKYIIAKCEKLGVVYKNALATLRIIGDVKEVNISVSERMNGMEQPNISITCILHENLKLKILEYDQKICGWDRSKFLNAYFCDKHNVKGLVALEKQTGDVVGYASYSIVGNSSTTKIGPLYADSLSIALSVLVNITNNIKGNIFLRVPENQRDFIDVLIKDAKCRIEKQSMRYFTKKFSPIFHQENVFAFFGYQCVGDC